MRLTGQGLAVLVVLLASCSSLPTARATDLPGEVSASDQGDWIVLAPRALDSREVGVVFYPGGLVRPEAYERALSPLAAAGYPVAIARMPLDLAFFDADKALRLSGSLPGTKRWVLAGHSLGGVAATMALRKAPASFAGLILWAAYPSKDDDLSLLPVPVLSISASLDGLATVAKLTEAEVRLPAGTEHFVVEGGNHSQFGDYGPQKGDRSAAITREQQQAAVAEASLRFLSALSP